MNVGIVVDNELNNDVRVLREIRILKEEGFNIFVLCFDFRKIYKDPVSGIYITRIRIHRKLKDILFFFLNTISLYEWFWSIKIKKHILKNNLEVLHAHDLYMACAAHSGIKKSGKKIPLILDLHENYPFTVTTYNWTKGLLRRFFSRPDTWKKKEREYLGYADKIVVLSDEYRGSLLQEYPDLSEDSFTVFPNVPDISSPEYINKTVVKKPFTNRQPVMLYYGVIAERRGILEALSVFSELVKEGRKVNLLLIGPVDKKDHKHFKEMISTVHFKGNLIHIPWINSADFPGYLEFADICLAPFRKNPQHESGIANKIYDYMHGGKPLIVSDCGPQKNLVEKYNCGLAFSNNREFKDAIVRLLEDESMRRSMGNNGRNAIINFYNVAVYRENILTVYRKPASG